MSGKGLALAYVLFFVLGLALFCVGCDTGGGGGGDDDVDDDDGGPTITPGFVWIPHGTFIMGSPEGEPGRRIDETQHEVTLSHDFEMMAKEVTQGHFAEVMGYEPSYFPLFGSDPNLPVEQVSWYDALVYANRLSEAGGYDSCYVLSDVVCADESPGDAVDYCKDRGGIFSADVSLNGVDSVYECEGFRLPTESEWEYAARAGTTTAFYNGPIAFTACSPVDPNLDLIAWFCGNAKQRTHTVGIKLPNAWGLYDMSGNVMEWTWDWYAIEYPESATDPEGPADGHFKVVRGGSYRYSGAGRCRSAYRAGHTPNFRARFVGFRLVRTLPSDADDESEKAPSPSPPVNDVESGVVDIAGVGAGKGGQRDYPDSLPFEFTRPDEGVPPTPAEITAFTKKLTGFWKDVEFFHWALWHSHGMDASNPDGMPDYKLYWQDTVAVKSGDVVTFLHTGWADNLMIRTGKVLNNAIAGYLMSGDETMGKLIEQYSKGIVCLIMGNMWDEQDPERYIMPRTIFTQDHSYTEEGRQAYVDYSPVRHEAEDWNALTINNPNNPYWGDIWIRTMRSKDDICHIFRIVPMLMRVAEDGQDEDVREAAARALHYLQEFARDIVESGYYVRTKDKYGNQYVPLDDYGTVNDLASFVKYEFIAPNAECNAKLAAALIAYGNPLDINCGTGSGGLYEIVATKSHYFNYAIIRYFHISATTNALMNWQVDIAKELLKGLAQRADAMMDGEGNWEDYADWDADVASYLLAASTAGLPLTSREARHVMEQYSLAVDHYSTWPYWDLWDPSVPDGQYDYRPSRHGPLGTVVRPTELIYPLEYCYSPFKNPATKEFIDCDVVADPSRWGE